MAKKKKASAKAKTAKTSKKTVSAAPAKKVGFEKTSKARTKSQILGALSGNTGLTKRQVGEVFESLSNLIGHDLGKGPGTFTLPGLVKMVVVRKPATKARKGINPFTGEEMIFKAKPARNVVRARPLKALKNMV